MRVLFVCKDSAVEHLGLMYISAMLKKNGHSAEIAEADHLSVGKKLEDGIPTVLAYSSLAFYADFFLKLNRKIKQTYAVFSVFGGAHPTAFPQIIDDPDVDCVCVGEGEYPLLELLDAIEKKQDITGIENLWIKINGRIFKNNSRPLIEDLDSLPFPDRELFAEKSPFFQQRISVITSRGCAYNCPYCYNSTLRNLYKDRKNIYRRRSVDNVIQEIQQVKNSQAVRFVMFHDDIFILQKQWLKEFSPKYRREIGIPFSCYARIDMIDEETVSLLSQAGCRSVSFGLEAANDFTRQKVYKRDMSKQQILRNAGILRKAGIKIRTTNIIGAASGSFSADLETLKLNIECRTDLAKIGFLSFYPGTDIARTADCADNWAVFKTSKTPFLIKVLGYISPNIVRRYKRLTAYYQTSLIPAEDEKERQRMINLFLLFPVIVGLPALFGAVRFLTGLPVNIFFVFAHFAWDNYCSYCRIYDSGFLSAVSGFFRAEKMSAGSKKINTNAQGLKYGNESLSPV